MKKALYTLFIIVSAPLFSACSSDEATPSTKGSLVIDGLSLADTDQVPVTTRAVDADLRIDILDADGNVVRHLAEGDAATGAKIELSEGAYELRAYTSNHATTYSGSDPGAAKFYGTRSFKIVKDVVTYVSMKVPMTNAAVALVLPDNFDSLFTDYAFLVTIGSRSMRLQSGEEAYFDIPQTSPEATYAFTATNTDGETMAASGSFEVTAGTRYTVTYNYSSNTPSFIVRE